MALVSDKRPTLEKAIAEIEEKLKHASIEQSGSLKSQMADEKARLYMEKQKYAGYEVGLRSFFPPFCLRFFRSLSRYLLRLSCRHTERVYKTSTQLPAVHDGADKNFGRGETVEGSDGKGN